MAEVVIIYGKSGSGKSRSLKNFGADEILFINVANKRLPFRGQFNATYEPLTRTVFNADGKVVNTYWKIRNYVKAMLEQNPQIKTIVIDDIGYVMTDEFMAGHSLKKGGNQFDLYNEIGDTIYNLFNFFKRELADDVLVYMIFHEESNDYGEVKLRTIGKLLEQKVCIEGMVTICLHAITEGGRHFFRTQSNGYDISKSPEEMLDLEEDNDLKAIDTKIREYWEL